MATRVPITALVSLVAFSVMLGGSSFVLYGEENQLPETRPLTWSEAELPDLLMDGAHRFIERKIGDAAKNRHRFWPPKDAAAGRWTEMVESNRAHLRSIIGAVDHRLPPAMEYFGSELDGALVFRGEKFRIGQVRWRVLDGVFGEGLLVSPVEPVAAAVVIPDSDHTPEQLLGISEDSKVDSHFLQQLLASNVEILIPTLVSREKLATSDPRMKRSDQTNREWLYRQAFHMGRHVIGYEVQKVLAAVDWFESRRTLKQIPEQARIGVAGYGEGGLLAFYAAALDDRIDTTLVSGYFDSRESIWSEPIYRNIWSLLNRFGDAEIASMILPRKLVIEHSKHPTVSGHKGDLSTPPLERVLQELARIHPPPAAEPPSLIHENGGAATAPYSERAILAFMEHLGIHDLAVTTESITDVRHAFSAKERQLRMVKQIEQHVQGLVRESEHVRDQFMLYKIIPEFTDSKWSTERRHPVHSPQVFSEGAREFRRRFYDEALGRFDEPLLPPNARTRRVIETEAWTAYDVVLDVFDGLIAWGVLVVPKNLKQGERRPVVVCQHGRQGIPRDTIDGHKTAYNDFAAELAERGFITFAPHNLYRGEDRYRWLDRKANTIGCTLFSFIVAQHDQILHWLDSLPFVDGERIAFYGLSYGGETAVRVPTILEKYCLSICSGDFNQWTRKVAATDQPFSFMRTIEWEMPYWNLGHTFDYAEMTYLMVPRPFMVERGHHDRVGRDRWVAHEFAKVRWLYAQLGLADRVELEFFQGGHSINGEGAFAFLHKHLEWPVPDDLR